MFGALTIAYRNFNHTCREIRRELEETRPMTDEPEPMPHGIAVEVGDIDVLEDRKKWTVRRAILIQFATEDECKEAIERRGMTFGLFDDERTEGDEPCGR